MNSIRNSIMNMSISQNSFTGATRAAPRPSNAAPNQVLPGSILHATAPPSRARAATFRGSTAVTPSSAGG
jgi:hypothetical protein